MVYLQESWVESWGRLMIYFSDLQHLWFLCSWILSKISRQFIKTPQNHPLMSLRLFQHLVLQKKVHHSFHYLITIIFQLFFVFWTVSFLLLGSVLMQDQTFASNLTSQSLGSHNQYNCLRYDLFPAYLCLQGTVCLALIWFYLLCSDRLSLFCFTK